MKRQTRFISLSGKGGSGKTTTASLLLAALLRRNIYRDILVVDADPDANLSQTLGVEAEITIGRILDQRRKALDEEGAAGTRLRFLFWDAIVPGPGFDFLVMGRSLGQGCYCSVNTALKTVMEETAAKYDLVLIDFDAGLEHFSRRAGAEVDVLLITCDPSRLSFDTAGRIKNLVEELALPYEKMFVVGCRYAPEQNAEFFNLAAKTGMEVLGLIPHDPGIAAKNMAGESLLTMAPDNPAGQAASGFLDVILS